MRIRTLLACCSLLTLFAGCSDDSNSPTEPPPTGPELTSLAVEPPIAELDIGTTASFRAVGTYSDGSVIDVSADVDWSLEFDTGILQVITDADKPDDFFVEAGIIGNENIVAALDGIDAIARVSVIDASLSAMEINPQAADMVVGSTRLFTVTGIYEDGRRQDLTDESTWGTGDESIATVTGEGVATAQAVGNTAVSATFSNLSASASVQVRVETEIEYIEITPRDVKLLTGNSQNFNATAYYSDGSTQRVTDTVLWTSSDTSVAEEDSFRNGQFRGVSAGEAEISADLGIRFQDTTAITVEDVSITRIRISPADLILPVGQDRRYLTDAVGSDERLYSLNGSPDLKYEVADSSVAYISNGPDSKGTLTALREGTTTVISTFDYEGETYTDQATLTVCQGGSC
jgi:hypothetical protein